MAFDESLAARIRDALARRKGVDEKTMFGCIGFFIDGNALAGVWNHRLIARLGPDEGETALREPHARHDGSKKIAGKALGGRPELAAYSSSSALAHGGTSDARPRPQ